MVKKLIVFDSLRIIDCGMHVQLAKHPSIRGARRKEKNRTHLQQSIHKIN